VLKNRFSKSKFFQPKNFDAEQFREQHVFGQFKSWFASAKGSIQTHEVKDRVVEKIY
jgi:hypothetical protein